MDNFVYHRLQFFHEVGHLIGTVFDHAQLLFPLPRQLCRFQKVVLNGVDKLYACRCC